MDALNQIYAKEIEIDEAVIRLRTDGIVHVTYKENCTLTVELQEAMMILFREVCGENTRRPFLFDAMDNVVITREARDNAVRIEHLAPSLCYAVVAPSLAYKLIADFYLKINKPKLPYKVFKNKESAVEWLLSFTNKK